MTRYAYSIDDGSDIASIVDALVNEKLDELREELVSEHEAVVQALEKQVGDLEDELHEITRERDRLSRRVQELEEGGRA